MNPICGYMGNPRDARDKQRRPEDGDMREACDEPKPTEGPDMARGLVSRQPINSEFNEGPWGPMREKVTCKN